MNRYRIYTYDSKGKDMIIPVYAESADDALRQFRILYGNAPVDFVCYAPR